MNCEKCQDLLSDFLDGTLAAGERAKLDAHLGECLPCASVRDELDSIVGFCREHRGEDEAPPNSQALWLRIYNTVESERQAAAAAAQAELLRRQSRWWTRWLDRSWELSLSQMATAVAMIVVAVSLATVVSFRITRSPVEAGRAAGTEDRPGGKLESAVDGARLVSLPVDDRVRQQQMDIAYWRQRVEQRMARWSPRMRETFERNMGVYERVVEDSRRELTRNPHDEVSEEMLHAALNDKMELLKEFSDQ